MPRISHSEFREELDRLSSSPGAVPHTVQDGGTVAPTDRVPPAQDPSTRRAARSRPETPNPVGILGAVQDAICIPYSLFPETVVRNGRGNPGPPLPGTPSENDTHNTLQRFCDGGSPSFVPPTPVLPFTGGQCEILYRYNTSVQGYNGNDCSPRSPSTSSATIWGPVLGTRTVFEAVGSDDKGRTIVEAYAKGKGGSPTSSFQWDIVGGASRGSSSCPEASLISFNVTPEDGSADVCGNPRPVYRDSGDISISPNIDIDIGPGVPIGISPTVSFELNGDININLPDFGDVVIDIGGIDINFPPRSPDEPGGDSPTPPRPEPGDTEPDPDSPAPPAPPPDDPAIEEPPEQPDKVIRAVLVTVVAGAPNIGTLFQDGNPDIGIPNYGFVSFRCRVDGQSSGWTEDLPVKNRRNFITCPWSGGAFDVKGTPRPGVEWTLTPILDLPLATQEV